MPSSIRYLTVAHINFRQHANQGLDLLSDALRLRAERPGTHYKIRPHAMSGWIVCKARLGPTSIMGLIVYNPSA